jgi:hypothetical protein
LVASNSSADTGHQAATYVELQAKKVIPAFLVD